MNISNTGKDIIKQSSHEELLSTLMNVMNMVYQYHKRWIGHYFETSSRGKRKKQIHLSIYQSVSLASLFGGVDNDKTEICNEPFVLHL